MKLACFAIILLSFLPFVRAIFDIVKKWRQKKRGIKLISVLGWFFLSLFMVRFAEVLYLNFISNPDTLPQGVSGAISAFSSGIVHALQSFSLDESYGDMFAAGLSVVQLYLPGPIPEFIFTIYFALQNIAAPVAGGAILLDILAGVSADLQIKWRQRKEKHIFSCATNETVALAESIPGIGEDKVAIFTDFAGDSDDEEEKALEERMEANDFIFTGDHITSLKISAAKSPLFFYLMDEDEESNINQLLELWNWRETLLEGCSKKDAPYVTIFFFIEDGQSFRLINSLMDQCADDPRMDIKVVDSRLNLIGDLADKKPVSSRLETVLGSKSTGGARVVFVGDDIPFAVQLVSTFNLYCDGKIEKDCVRPHVTLASSMDRESIERQFESAALYLPKNLREKINPDSICTWDGTDAGLNELANSADALGNCEMIVIAGDADLRNMQQASVLDNSYGEAGLAEADRPVIACLIRDDSIAEQFKNMFGPNVVPFGTDSEMNSYEVACKGIDKDALALLAD